MIKDILLTLKSIKYTGKSIGNDIRIEIETIGELFQKNIELNKGETQGFDVQIAVFRRDQNSFSIPIVVRVIERDPVSNDVGEINARLQVDLDRHQIQKKSVMVEVIENRWAIVKFKARFKVSFDIQVMDVMHYIDETHDGFLIVKIDGHDGIHSLPAFLKVRFDRHDQGRDYFTIMEGWRQGQTGSVKLDENGSSFLVSGNPHTRPIRVTYFRSKQRLKIKRKSYRVIEHPGEPWENGFYDIEIADDPHKGGIPYLDKAPKAKVWFHIGHEHRPGIDEEKYIHTGSQTLGCITLTQHRKWDEVYEILIKARLGDSKSIGILEVVD